MKQIKHQVIIIGSGFGGQAAAINLTKKGITDFKILERRNFMGGTWCQNTYPGAAVDVQSPLYSISFEPYPWSQMFADGKELKDYTNHIIDKHNLRVKTSINTNVTKTQWNEVDKRWHIETSKDSYIAQFIINASGPLSMPVVPNFKGKELFKGESFHTNNWNHDFDYTGKRVAIIGSGASAAQVIPAVAPKVDHLHVFQRSAHWVMPRHDYVFNDFERKLININFIHKLIRIIVYWSLESRIIGFKYSSKLLKLFAQRKAENLLKKKVKDDELRKKLTPDYTIGCKRIILSNKLLPTFCRDNVSLLTKEESIKEITETGIITNDGQNIELDLIVYSTGYDATDGLISYPVIGKDNHKLSDFWADYPRAYLGTTMPNFPNLFIVTGPNTGIGHTSAIFVIESQLNYVKDSITKTLDQKNEAIEVTAEAEEKYTEEIHKEMEGTVWQNGGCNSWYKSANGKVIAMFPGFTFEYLYKAKNFKTKDHQFS